MKVEVYKNLHTGTFSVRKKGKVIAHPTTVYLTDATFVVRPGGRERVRREGRKNVHAFVRGTPGEPRIEGTCSRVTYNPYEHDTFVDGSGAPVRTAAEVIMSITETSTVILAFDACP